MAYTAHVDTFARDHLPPRDQWPDLLFGRPELQYPDRLNCCIAFLDRWVEEGRGDAVCLVSPEETLTYRQLQERVNRICNVLVERLGFVPGNRVLLRSANNPTMPLLRAKEIAFPVQKAKIAIALCDHRLADEMERSRALAPDLRQVVYWGSGAPDSLEAMMADVSPDFTAAETAADDVCLIGFTSGTTGEPKGTMHFHRDMLAICDAYARNVLRAEGSDRFIGSPPLAFTFGLGGIVLFPMHVGASTILLERAGPDDLLHAISQYRASVCFTAPTAYRAMLVKLQQHDVSSLRKCVSAGEPLPKATFEAWHAATGIKLMDGIGATEMLHIFIAAREEDIRPGATGRPVPGYEAKVIDQEGRDLPAGSIGRLAVRGPTGCRYLADDRQGKYVRNGWNITGDTYVMDGDGYFWYQARSDDMIVGAPDSERGMIVKAYVVLHPGHTPGPDLTKLLQDYVKAEIAPYKYPRAIEYVDALPRTQTGKLQRFELRRIAVSVQGTAGATAERTAAAE
jgi:2-aminobenzoate-CoA ligase